MKGKRLLGNAMPVLQYFYSFVWHHEPSYFLLLAGDMLLRGLSPFVNIVLPKFIIDELLGAKRVPVLAALVGAVAGANFVVYLLGNLRTYLLGRAHHSLQMKLDEQIGRKTMEMDFEYTESPQALNQLEKATTGISWYSGGIEGLSTNLTLIVASLIRLAGTLYIIALLSPWLVALILATVAGSLFVTSKNQQLQVQFMKDLVGINRRFSYYFSILKDFRYGKDIRLYDASGMLMKRVDQYITEDWGIEKKRTAIWNRFAVILSFLGTAQEGLLYAYLGLRALAGLITVGDLQMLVSAARTFAQSLTDALGQVITMGKNVDFMNEYKVFMEYPQVKKTGTAVPPKQPRHVLEVRGVSFKYPGSEEFVLKDVSLQIPAGQRLAFDGPNGAGKTTLVKLLTRLYDPTEGQILLDGVDIREFDLEEYAKLFAVVFQDFRLLAFSVRDNLTLGGAGDEDAIRRSLQLAGLADKLAGLRKGLDTPIYKTFDEDGIEFSGGESQKLAIARALYKNAPIVILDEPTAALDPVAESEVYRRFDQLTSGKTAIYISHRLSSCRFCDRIAVFDHGRIAELGTHDELAGSGGLYAQMWNAQAQWYVSASASASSASPDLAHLACPTKLAKAAN
ncbi:MAG: ABC transporter ATP-binding protein [Limnochordaceae bacterium]|nr:ABC transporter ATP-binding protein [Limnochordaceae bacterium]